MQLGKLSRFHRKNRRRLDFRTHREIKTWSDEWVPIEMPDDGEVLFDHKRLETQRCASTVYKQHRDIVITHCEPDTTRCSNKSEIARDIFYSQSNNPCQKRKFSIRPKLKIQENMCLSQRLSENRRCFPQNILLPFHVKPLRLEIRPRTSRMLQCPQEMVNRSRSRSKTRTAHRERRCTLNSQATSAMAQSKKPSLQQLTYEAPDIVPWQVQRLSGKQSFEFHI